MRLTSRTHAPANLLDQMEVVFDGHLVERDVTLQSWLLSDLDRRRAVDLAGHVLSHTLVQTCQHQDALINSDRTVSMTSYATQQDSTQDFE